MTPATVTNPALRRPVGSGGLYEVLDLILDKGLVVDAYIRVSLVGIELVTVDLRVVVASVDTYLRWAEAAERLVLRSDPRDLGEIVGGGGVLGRAADAVGDREEKGGLISRLTGGGHKTDKSEHEDKKEKKKEKEKENA